jgi:hypothetical protein
MKIRAKNVAWLLPFFLTGCFHFHFHKAQQQQAQSLAPPASTAPKPAPAHPDLPDSAVTIPPQPIKTSADAVEVAPKAPPRHKKPPAKNTQQAAVTPPAPAENPAVSAIGQLSSGDPSDQKRQTEDSIADTERRLNGLGANLNDQEQKTAAQIRAYLKHAKDALNSGDVDGAITLAAKAKAVLSELIH